jgi:uncharacterized protein YkwD
MGCWDREAILNNKRALTVLGIATLLACVLLLLSLGPAAAVQEGDEPIVYHTYLPLLSHIPPPSPRGCVPEAYYSAQSLSNEREVVRLLNLYRVSQGLPALNFIPQLVQAARRHAQDMAENDFVAHQGSDGSDAGARMREACYRWSAVGQIIGSGATPLGMVSAWISSEANRSLLLSEDFIDIGAAYSYRPDSSNGHFWVITFGRPFSAGSPP